MTARRQAERGLTLYELLVVLPLCVLVAGMVLELLMTGGRLFSDAEDRLDTQAAALITLHTLGRELRATTCSSLTVTGTSQGGVACAFRRNAVTPVRPDDSGSPFVIYWLDTRQQTIDRLEVSKDASFQRLTPVFIAAALAAEPTPRVMAHLVRDLTFSVTSGDADGTS